MYFQNVPTRCVKIACASQAVLERHEVPGVEGAFVVTGVLTREECVRVAAMTEAMGYADPPLSIGRNVRANSNVEWTVDDTVIGPIFERCRHLLPQHVEGGDLCGVNGESLRVDVKNR